MNTPSAATLAYLELEPDDILDAVEALGFDVNGRLLALNSYENRVYQVGIGERDNCVAKFYRPERWSDDAIREEHEFATELANAEIPVVAPLEIDGETLHYAGLFRVAVYPCHGGRSPDLDDLDQLEQLGRLVARIHNVGATRAFRFRPAIDIDSFGTESVDYLLDEERIPAELEPAYSTVADDVLDAVETCFEQAGGVRTLRLHGDFHPGNVLVNRDRFHLVDLDDARTGPAVQDLWMFLSGERPEQEPQLAALLKGYTAFRDFDPIELHLVEALRSLRLMHYAAWLARRWDDPAFKQAFPWFASPRYWEDHVLSLREQIALMQEPPLRWHED
ncbi:MAG: serine/threonine protein kinase [Woeseiaceae bacterium]|jgi:Ser/Thr protein kinase RdoA (MazF antagonist)|nr:serine/threonine protein kinase [Woeseiaceae bacterium]